jgi:hypothetical protein
MIFKKIKDFFFKTPEVNINLIDKKRELELKNIKSLPMIKRLKK